MRADTERTGRISADQFADIFLPAATVASEPAPPPSSPLAAMHKSSSISSRASDAGLTPGEDFEFSPHRALRRLFALLDTDGNGWLNCGCLCNARAMASCPPAFLPPPILRPRVSRRPLRRQRA